MNVKSSHTFAVLPAVVWYVSNTFSAYFSKSVLQSSPDDHGGGDIQELIHLALWLSFAQLLVSAVIGAFITFFLRSLNRGSGTHPWKELVFVLFPGEGKEAPSIQQNHPDIRLQCNWIHLRQYCVHQW